jgi:hypothetical protein
MRIAPMLVRGFDIYSCALREQMDLGIVFELDRGIANIRCHGGQADLSQ